MTLFAFDTDAKGHITGREYGWNCRQVAERVDLAIARKMSIIFGIYEPGQLKLAQHYINQVVYTPGSFIDFHLIGEYAL